MRPLIITLLGLLAFALIGIETGFAAAVALCGNRALIVERLRERFAEERIASGVTNNGGVLEVFTSAAATWTFLLTRPSGETCLVAAGAGWEKAEPVREGVLL